MVEFGSRVPSSAWRRIIPALGVLIIGGIVTSCGSGESAAPSAQSSYPPNGETVAIQSLDNSFRPQEFEVVAGTEVVFENRGRNDHNVLPATVASDAELTELLDSGDSFAWGVIAAEFVPGDEYAHVFTTPGTYAYYCSIHGKPDAGMYGVLVVTAP